MGGINKVKIGHGIAFNLVFLVLIIQLPKAWTNCSASHFHARCDMSGNDESIQRGRWNLARHRDRNEARYKIRQIVSSACSNEVNVEGYGQATMIVKPRYNRENGMFTAISDEERPKIKAHFNSVSNGSGKFRV